MHETLPQPNLDQMPGMIDMSGFEDQLRLDDMMNGLMSTQLVAESLSLDDQAGHAFDEAQVDALMSPSLNVTSFAEIGEAMAMFEHYRITEEQNRFFGESDAKRRKSEKKIGQAQQSLLALSLGFVSLTSSDQKQLVTV